MEIHHIRREGSKILVEAGQSSPCLQVGSENSVSFFINYAANRLHYNCPYLNNIIPTDERPATPPRVLLQV